MCLQVLVNTNLTNTTQSTTLEDQVPRAFSKVLMVKQIALFIKVPILSTANFTLKSMIRNFRIFWVQVLESTNMNSTKVLSITIDRARKGSPFQE